MSDMKPSSRPYWIWGFNALLFAFSLWGFLHVPSYRIPTWPESWAPTGDRWEADWTEIGTDLSGSPIVDVRVLPETRSLLLMIAELDEKGEMKGVRYDLAAKTVVARGAPGGVAILGPTRWTLLEDNQTLTVSGLGFDSDTLQVKQRTFRLREPSASQIAINGIHEFPNGEATMLLWYGSSMQVGELYWVRFDAGGHAIAQRRIGELYPWICEVRPAAHPVAFVSQAGARFNNNFTGVDIRTGELCQAPAKEHHIPESITWRFAALTTRRGYSPMMFNRDYEANDCALELHYAAPSVLANVYPPSLDKRERAVQSLARIRRSVWNLIYSDEFLRDRELEARTLDQVYLRVAGDDLAPWLPVQGDLAMTVRVASHRDRGPRVTTARKSDDPFRSEEPTVAEFQTQVQLRAHRGPDQSVIVTQFLTDLPSPLQLPNGILRIGLIPAGSDTVTWIGYLPMSETEPIPTTETRQLQLARIGDDLLLMSTFPGDTTTNPSIWYTLIPCPKELMALPEGELR